jgi:phytoene dehydrogenase-like protein
MPLVQNWEKLLDEVLCPLHFPKHILILLRFGIHASQSIDHFVCGKFKASRARALFAGISAHSIMPMHRPGGAAFGLVLGAAAHAVGWPLAKGGSQSIANALNRHFTDIGGEIHTGVDVRSLKELPKARAVLLDITPRQLAVIAGESLPQAYKQRLIGYQYGPGIFKMDWSLSNPIPWIASNCSKAATVHIGGVFEEIAHAENIVCNGKHADKPFVILAQPSLFDPTRAPCGKQTAWAYCHVPNSSTHDMSEKIEAQVERFAPGFRDSIMTRSIMNTAAVEAYNPNYVGGDIAGGINDPLRLLIRQLGQWRPYSTPIKGVYLCSSSMPPGAGVHGMCGYYAAVLALKGLVQKQAKPKICQ